MTKPNYCKIKSKDYNCVTCVLKNHPYDFDCKGKPIEVEEEEIMQEEPEEKNSNLDFQVKRPPFVKKMNTEKSEWMSLKDALELVRDKEQFTLDLLKIYKAYKNGKDKSTPVRKVNDSFILKRSYFESDFTQ